MHQELTPRPLRAVALAGSLVAGLLAPPPVAAQTKEYLYVTNALRRRQLRRRGPLAAHDRKLKSLLFLTSTYGGA